jgi:hypothetical protein
VNMAMLPCGAFYGQSCGWLVDCSYGETGPIENGYGARCDLRMA